MDLRKVKKLIELVEESGIQELAVSSGDESIRITMPGGLAASTAPAMVTPPAAASTVRAAEPLPSIQENSSSSSTLTNIHAPMAGTFYRAPHPDAPAFVDVGSQVNEGDVICIIESMKMMHEIRAQESGCVHSIGVENGQPIETGDVLFSLS